MDHISLRIHAAIIFTLLKFIVVNVNPTIHSEPSLGLRALEPQCFTGKKGEDEDSDRWLKRYECFRKTYNWSDVEAINYMDLFLEEAEVKSLEGVIKIIEKEQKLEKKVNTRPHYSSDASKLVKEVDPIQRPMLKFDELSLKLLNRDISHVHNSSEYPIKNNC
ncbi:hypothetical protein AYI70_g3388 [Smittium culicis]|uniref:Uncharacterized protein n=1 Tax=Smittium culicis TaxID=133412 RepID=A0A1R1XF66_9FUNG|nr:hypothetical protein AYI70_g8611 [Smittium culicis]OMJ21602.1 hypothetical protein AYI70_g3388 [Smittium culicis]